MEALEAFKSYLLKQKTSKITVKNYLADIRKFIRWYENTYQQPFHALLVNHKAIEAFKNQPYNPSEPISIPSLKRYLSSLRKFFYYLAEIGAIPTNPFLSVPEKTQETDPWRLKEFKNFLFSGKASKLTIKNYLLDIRQFMSWLEKVTEENEKIEKAEKTIQYKGGTFYSNTPPTSANYQSDEATDYTPRNIFSQVDTFAVNEYKTRLLQDKQLSPVSINRKLSSLRKYIAWLHDKRLILTDVKIADLQDAPQTRSQPQAIANLPLSSTPELISEELRVLASVLPQAEEQETQNAFISASKTESVSQKNNYSRFPPLRFLQKSKKLITHGADLLILLPIVGLLQNLNYTLWKVKGREVFTPINEIIPLLADASLHRTLTQPQAAISKISKILQRPVVTQNERKGISPLPIVTNVPKSLYAPLKISIKHLSPYKKVLHHLRHTRPNWYKKYHSYPIVHYFHFAVFLVFSTSIGFGLYSSFFHDPASKNPVLAAPAAPPRVLSFQGRLTDVSGNPITSATTLRFAIYNDETDSGVAQLWEEPQSLTPDEDGVFTAYLGNNTPIAQSLFAENASLWLGIAVGTDDELQPRQPLATVAYASNAETLQGLAPITQINAGTRNVILALDSAGNLTIAGTASPVFQATGGTFTLSGRTLVLSSTPGSNGNVQLSPDGSGIVDIQKAIKNTSNNGGIPGAVEVQDMFAVSATSSSHAAFSINQNSTGNLITASASGVSKFTVDYTGAGTFGNSLTIRGDSLITSASTFNLINSTATSLNIGGAATSISLGASSGTTTINNSLAVTGLITANGNLLVPSGKVLNVSGNVGSHLIASSSSTFDLGSSSTYWRNGYITNLFANPSATTSGFWFRSGGALSPINSLDDFLLGSSATASAKFAFINVAAGTPIASLSAGSSGATYLTGTGNLATTAMQTLSIGGATTGHISFVPGGSTAVTMTTNGNIGIGTTSPLARLDINGAGSGTLPIASLSGSTTFAGLMVDNSGTGNIFTASKSGATKFTILNNGNIQFAGTTNFLSTLGSEATASRTWTLPDVDGIICVSGSSCASSGTVGFWQRGSGALTPATITDDLLLGSTATTSAKFAFINVAGGTPTASIAANSGNNATYLTGLGNLGTTNMQTLTLGGSTTGDIVLQPGSGNVQLSNTTTLTASSLASITSAATLGISATALNLGNGSAATIGTTTNANLTLRPNGTGLIGMFTSSPLASLDIRANSGTLPVASISGATSFAGLTVDNSGTGDIFAASSSGQNRFVITQNGSVGIGTTNPTEKLTIEDDADIYMKIRAITGNGQATGIKFQRGTTTDTFNDWSMYVNSLGNLFFDRSVNGVSTTQLAFDAFDNIGFGTTSPLAKLDIRGNGTTRPVASMSGNTTFAAMIVDNISTGDLFTASKSGATKFTIANNGSLQFAGTTNFLSTIDSAVTASRTWTLPDVSGTICVIGSPSCGVGIDTWTGNASLGVVNTSNSTMDVLIGGTATSSAKFAFLNVAGGTPTASISATTTGLSLGGNGIIQSLQKGTLTLGGSTTGNIQLIPGNTTSMTLTSNGNVGIGTTSPRSILDVVGTSQAVVTIGDDANGGRINFGDTASINSLAYSNSQFGLFTSQSNGMRFFTNADADTTTPEVIITDAGTVGIGTTSPLATLDIRGNSGTSPAASISAQSTFAAMVVDNSGTGDIFAASTSGLSRFTLTNDGKMRMYYNSSTPLELYPVNTFTGEYGLATNQLMLTQGRLDFEPLTGRFELRTTGATTDFNIYNKTTGEYLMQLDGETHNVAFGNVGATGSIYTPVATLDIRNGITTQPTASFSGQTIQAGMIIDNSGNGTIFTASKSGATKFTIANNGSLQFAGTTNFLSTIDSAATASRTWTLPDVSGTICVSGNSCATSGTVGYWTRTGTNLSPATATDTLSLGTTSPLATFDVRGNSGTTPAASISASSTFAAMIIDNTGTGDLFTASKSGATKFVITNSGSVGIGTTSPTEKLALEDNADIYMKIRALSSQQVGIKLQRGTTTDTLNDWNMYVNSVGNLFFDRSVNGITTTQLAFDAFNNVGLGTTSPVAKLDIRGNGTTVPVASISGDTTHSAMTVDNNGTGDLFTASKSGAIKFVIANNGNVTVFGTATTCTIGNGTSATNCSSSDQRLKDSIASLSGQTGLASLRQLRPVSYHWNNSMQKNGATTALQYGFIAQEVADIFPNMVERDQNTGYLKLDYQGFFAPIVKSIQELDAKIDNSGNIISSLSATTQITENSLRDTDGTTIANIGEFIRNAIATSLSTATDTILIGGQTIEEYIRSIVSEIPNSEILVQNPPKITSPTGEITTLKTNLISPLASESAISVGLEDSKFTIRADKTASSAAVVTIDNQGNASFSGTLRADRLIAGSIDGLDEKLASLEANVNQRLDQRLSVTNNPSSPSATPQPTPTGVHIPTTNSQEPVTNFASISGELAYVPNFTAEFGRFNQGLIALGPTSLTDAAISNQLRIGSSMTIDQNSINTFGTDLHIQPFRQGNINFMGSAVVIDTEGNLNVNGNAVFAKDVKIQGKLMAKVLAPVPDEDLIIQLGKGSKGNLVVKDASGSGVLSVNHLGDLIASGAGTFKSIATGGISIIRGAQADTSMTETVASASAGTATITANETERTIYSPYVREDSLIYVTATSNTYGQTPYIARQTAENKKKNIKGSFSVQVSEAVTKDIKFNWWIVN